MCTSWVSWVEREGGRSLTGYGTRTRRWRWTKESVHTVFLSFFFVTWRKKCNDDTWIKLLLRLTMLSSINNKIMLARNLQTAGLVLILLFLWPVGEAKLSLKHLTAQTWLIVHPRVTIYKNKISCAQVRRYRPFAMIRGPWPGPWWNRIHGAGGGEA